MNQGIYSQLKAALSKLYVRIIFSVVVGLLLASFFTKITYVCVAMVGADCRGTEFAILHPSDLMDNPPERGNFIETFVAGSLVTFIALSFVVRFKHKP